MKIHFYLKKKDKLTKDYPGYRHRDLIVFFVAVIVNAYSISRAAGAIYQSRRDNAIVKVTIIKIYCTKMKISFKGACLRYDPVEQILIATPFAGGINCWNIADWLVILLPIFIFPTVYVVIKWYCEDEDESHLDEDEKPSSLDLSPTLHQWSSQSFDSSPSYDSSPYSY